MKCRNLQEKKYESSTSINTILNSSSIMPTLKLGISLNEEKEKIKQSFKRIIEEAEKSEEDFKRFKEVILFLGYPPSDNMDIRLIRKIGKVCIEEGVNHLKKIIDDLMKEFYSPERIDHLMKEWESYSFLKDRLPLLGQALKAHNLGMYSVAVPSLLSQMEGIIIDGFDVKGEVPGYLFKRLISLLFDNESISDKTDKSKAEELAELLRFEKLICDYYFNFLLEHFEHGQEEVSNVSRHAILHGGARPISYNHEHISLKMIIMMDNIIYQVSLLNADKKEKAIPILKKIQQITKKNREKRKA
ncbi:hypothetical protein ACV1QZ_06420 [Bacillus subtilis]